MKASNLSINVPNKGCNKSCPYCVSNMSGGKEICKSTQNFYRNMRKVKLIVKNTGVNTIMLSGKGEPLLNMDDLFLITQEFADYPMEIQTNGILLRDGKIVAQLYEFSISTVAISVDSLSQLEWLKPVLKNLKSYEFNIRLTVNLVDEIMNNLSADYFLEYCKENYVNQISFREITIPVNYVSTASSLKTKEWVEKNVSANSFIRFMRTFNNLIKSKGIFVQKLAFGASIYMVEGVSFTYFDYCIQDSNDGDDIRSFIYWDDGHMSTTWYSSNHGRIF